jgi:hypothetical protein
MIPLISGDVEFGIDDVLNCGSSSVYVGIFNILLEGSPQYGSQSFKINIFFTPFHLGALYSTTSSIATYASSISSIITTSDSSIGSISTFSDSSMGLSTSTSGSSTVPSIITYCSSIDLFATSGPVPNSTYTVIPTSTAIVTFCSDASCVTLTKTATSSALVTITLCSGNICSATVVVTGISYVTINSTTYTTYCPITSVVCTECAPISTTIIKTQKYTQTTNNQTVTEKVTYTTTECNYYTTVYPTGKPATTEPTTTAPTVTTTVAIAISTSGALSILPAATFEGAGSRATAQFCSIHYFVINVYIRVNL